MYIISSRYSLYFKSSTYLDRRNGKVFDDMARPFICYVFLVRRVSKNLQLYLDIVSRILISIFFVFVIYQGFKLSGLVSRQFSPAMRIPMNWVYLSLPISSIISLLFNLDLLIDSIVNIVIKTKS